MASPESALSLPSAPELRFGRLDRSDPTSRRFVVEHAIDLERPLPLRRHPRSEPWTLHPRDAPYLLGFAWATITETPRILGFFLWIAPPFRGQGWATRAGQAPLHAAFGEWSCDRVETACRMTDPAATALVERLQLLPEGVQRQAWVDPEGCHDLAHYGLLRADRRP